MPQRFLRPGITNSERWNSLQWRGQSFYIRLLTIVDDYGRCDGRTPVLHGQCFSMWNCMHPDQQVTFADLVEMIGDLCNAGLAEWYKSGDKHVIQLLQWQERIRAGTRPKWPEKNATCSNLQQPAGSCTELLPPTPSPSSPPSPTPTPSESVCAVEVEASLPAGFPKTEQEAVAIGSMQGIPDDFTIKTWRKAHGRGGRDARDVPVRFFASYLKTELTYHQNHEAEQKAKANGTHRSSTQPGAKDRNTGTYNAGRGKEYADFVRRKNSQARLQNVPGPTTGEHAGEGGVIPSGDAGKP